MLLPLLSVVLVAAPPATRVLVVELRAPGDLIHPQRLSDLDAAVNGSGPSSPFPAALLDPNPPTPDELELAESTIALAWPECPLADPARVAAVRNAVDVLQRNGGALARTDTETTRMLLRGHACLVTSGQQGPIHPLAPIAPGALAAIEDLVRAFPDLGGSYGLPPEELGLLVWSKFIEVQRRLGTGRVFIAGSGQAIYFDGHRVGTAPLSLYRVTLGRHFLQARPLSEGASSPPAERVRVIEVVEQRPLNLDASELLLSQRLSIEEGLPHVDHPSRDSRKNEGEAAARLLARRVGAEIWLTVFEDGEMLRLKASTGDRATTVVSCPPGSSSEIGAALVRTLRDEPQALSQPTLGRVALSVEQAGSDGTFVVLAAGSELPEGSPLTVPSTLYVTPGVVRVSANVADPKGTAIRVQVPESGAAVGLKPAAVGRGQVGVAIGGLGSAGLLVTLGALAVLEGLGSALPRSAGGGPGTASRVVGSNPTIPIVLVSSVGLLATGLVVALTAGSGVKWIKPLEPAPTAVPVVGVFLLSEGGMLTTTWRF